MSDTLRSPRHDALRKFLRAKRREAGLTQAEVAAKLGRRQNYIANIETGQRRVDVVELLDLAAAIGFDAQEALRVIHRVRGPRV